MIRFAADENFNGALVRGLFRRLPDLDLIRVQDTEVYRADDAVVLAWVTQNNRVLLTHDRSTVPFYLFERISSGLTTSGVFAISDELSFSTVIDDIVLITECSEQDEWVDRVLYFPL